MIISQEFVDKLTGFFIDDPDVMACGIKPSDASKELCFRYRDAAPARH
jgi:hypothetical protein